MKLTISQKILNFLATQEKKNKSAVFTPKVAQRKFRNVENIDGTIMRRARELASAKLLRRVGPGEYTLTARGRKSVK